MFWDVRGRSGTFVDVPCETVTWPFQLERRKQRATDSPTMATISKSVARKTRAPKVTTSKEYGKGKGKKAGAQAPPPPRKAPGKSIAALEQRPGDPTSRFNSQYRLA